MQRYLPEREKRAVKMTREWKYDEEDKRACEIVINWCMVPEKLVLPDHKVNHNDINQKY